MEAGIKIDLSSYSERFAEKSRELFITKKINFLFGKNGTGKTTIADAIKDQFSSDYSDYNVCVFKDFSGVLDENDRLNAIALGTENAEIQVKIKAIDKEIDEIKKEIDEPLDKTENFFTKEKKAISDHKKQEDKIDNFYRRSALIINQQSKPRIVSGNKTTYDKNDFRDEISSARLLSDDEIKKHKETIKSEKKENIRIVAFPNLDLSKWLISTNEILRSSVLQQLTIDELKDDTDKQNFAREGLRIHKHKNGEKCAFCGNEISEERWQLLGSYFNDEVTKFENRIKQNINEIDNELNELDYFGRIDEGDFYDKFVEQVKSLNLQIENTKNNYKNFLKSLRSDLNNKFHNLFIKSNELKLVIPINFDEIKKSYEGVVKENNDFSQNLIDEQEKAKNALRYHEVKKALDTFKYDTENTNLEHLKTKKDEAQRAMSDKRAELEQKKETKNELILQTKDEEKIAKQINKLLKNMGFVSFSLQLVDNDDENQKGQYRIKRWHHKENEFDDVVNLSKGEKNIVAFLYFLLSLEKISDDRKLKIVVLDDPMTSNDDVMQYLMISEIQKFYRNFNDGNYFFLLTHNCHFYLNVRPNTAKKHIINGQEISFYEKYGNYCLLSDGKHTSIRNIEKGHQDFKTNYDLLWKEIKFLYEEDGATANLMLNPFRKICETYMKFNCIVPETFFKDNVGVKKLYDVNQHSVDDLEAEQNGKTKDEIKQILKELFQNNNASDHFNNYWR